MQVNPSAAPLYIVNPLAARPRTARRARHGKPVLHPPADGGAHRAPPPDGGRQQPPAADLLGVLMGIQEEVEKLVNTESPRTSG